ncbi:MAG: GPW/gp25 family protein [Candidatus Rokuibacteriota bacterium]
MAETYLNFPFAFTADGSTAAADEDRHIRQRIEQILFTSPGERVMLPEFGCGVRDLVFAGTNDVLAAATEFTVARALQTQMANRIMVNAVDVVSDGEKLHIHVVYTKTRDLEQEKLVFQLLPLEGGRRG